MTRRGRNILVVRQDRLGDAINAVAVLKYLRHNQPGARVSFMTAATLVELFQGQPYTDDMVPYERGWFRLLWSLRRGRYDAVLMLKPAKTLAWASLFAGIGQKAGLGWRPYYPLTGIRSGYPATANDQSHEIDYNLAVAKRLFPGRTGDVVPEIKVTDGLKAHAQDELARHQLQWPVAVLPANRGSSPNWPVERYAALAEGLKLRGR